MQGESDGLKRLRMEQVVDGVCEAGLVRTADFFMRCQSVMKSRVAPDRRNE